MRHTGEQQLRLVMAEVKGMVNTIHMVCSVAKVWFGLVHEKL